MINDGLEAPEFESQQGQEICSPPKSPDRLPAVTQPPIQWVPGRKVDHSPLSTAEIKNE